MKRNFIFLVVAMMAMSLCFSSCSKKEGVYKPKKQITRVWYSAPSVAKYRVQECTWDGKLLSKIEHYSSSGSLSWTENFTYDKNRIVRVDDFANSEFIEYKYDGSKLKTVEYSYDGKLRNTINVTYDGKKISKLEIIKYTYNNKNAEAKEGHFRLFPASIEDRFDKMLEKRVSAKYTENSRTMTVDVKWDGDNISSTIYTVIANGTYEGYESTYNWSENYVAECSYTYDKKVNPIYGLRDMYCLIDFDDSTDRTIASFSKNNLTSYTSKWTETWTLGSDSDFDSGIDTYNYAYTYDGNVPSEVLYTHVADGDTYTYTLYYEYK